MRALDNYVRVCVRACARSVFMICSFSFHYWAGPHNYALLLCACVRVHAQWAIFLSVCIFFSAFHTTQAVGVFFVCTRSVGIIAC